MMTTKRLTNKNKEEWGSNTIKGSNNLVRNRDKARDNSNRDNRKYRTKIKTPIKWIRMLTFNIKTLFLILMVLNKCKYMISEEDLMANNYHKDKGHFNHLWVLGIK